MPGAISSVVFVLPGFAARFAERPLRVPSLERLAEYSEGVTTSSMSSAFEHWQAELLQALGVRATARFPSAPTTWLGARGEREPGTWFHADPVRMEIAASGLTLTPGKPWSEAELDLLSELLREYFEISQLQWQVAAQRAFIVWPAKIDVSTMSVQRALHEPLREALPQGEHGAEVRRVMTELQMLIHERFPPPRANALWLWGGGELCEGAVATLPLLYTNDAYARGVYLAQRAAKECEPVPSSIDEFLARHAPRAVFVIRDVDVDSLEERWFAPVLDALHAGRLDRVDVYLDGYSFSATASLWRRMFTRPRPLFESLR